MSMSTHVVGFKPPDEKWRHMKDVWDACAAAGIEPPDPVERFFNWEAPDPEGVQVALEDTPCCREWNSDMRQGFEISLFDLPPDVTVIRFYNSY